MEKNEFRKLFIDKRKSILDKKEKSKIIANRVADLCKNYKIIALYSSLNDEVDTQILFELLNKQGKILAFPKTNIDNSMNFYKIENYNDLINIGNYGIKEPCDIDANFIAKNNIELIVVPGICFDKNKNRIGFGKGFYDRFLENTNILKVGICFDEQVLINHMIPYDNNDIPMDIVVTDKQIIE